MAHRRVNNALRVGSQAPQGRETVRSALQALSTETPLVYQPVRLVIAAPSLPAARSTARCAPAGLSLQSLALHRVSGALEAISAPRTPRHGLVLIAAEVTTALTALPLRSRARTKCRRLADGVS